MIQHNTLSVTDLKETQKGLHDRIVRESAIDLSSDDDDEEEETPEKQNTRFHDFSYGYGRIYDDLTKRDHKEFHASDNFGGNPPFCFHALTLARTSSITFFLRASSFGYFSTSFSANMSMVISSRARLT